MIQNKIQTISGANAVIKALESIGTDTIFGYPGGIVLKLYDELYNQSTIKHILMRHEQSAVHAAEGYARTSGKCGVVLVTSGPGATNTVTGIVNAYLDGYPLIILTGQVDKDLIGKNAFQEANICDMVKSCTKATFQITDANDIEKTFTEAHKIATTGKKGPVLIDMAKNIFTQNIEFKNDTKHNAENNYQCSATDVQRVYSHILSSRKPLIVIGGGVNHSECKNELAKFIEKYNIPVVSTMMGLGAISSDNTSYLGMIGIFGDKSANEALIQSDTIISLGARFNDRITCIFEEQALDNKIIQIDINSSEISRNFTPKDYIVCDINDFLKKMNNCGSNEFIEQFEQWNTEAREYKNLNSEPQKISNMIHSFELIKKLDEYTKDKNVIFTSEVGQHQLWAVKNLKFGNNRRILVSGGSGTMGFGLPAAIGAAIANPEKTIVCITGDGSLQMSLGELAVCKEYGLNIKIIVLNNSYLGMVRQLQEKNCQKRYSQTKLSNPDFEKLAQSFGIESTKVNSVTNIEKAYEKAFLSDKTYLVDFEIEPMETV